MRKLLIAAALGLGVVSTGGGIRAAGGAPFRPGQVEFGVGATPVQYYRHGYYARPYYGPRRYYGPPRRYGYYAPPPPPPRYYRYHHHPYYGWR